MDFKPPKVCVVNINDNRPAAWRLSRPNAEGAPFVEADGWDVGLHDLKTVTFQVDGSAGFRELLTGLRPYAAWSQSSRINKVSDIPMTEYKDHQNIKSSQEAAWQEALHLTETVHQDVGRQTLPMGMWHQFTYQCSWRTAIGFIRSLYETSQDFYYQYYGKQMLDQMGMTEEDLLNSPVQSIWQHYGVDLSSWKPGDDEYAGIKIISCEMPVSWRAQMVRQTQVKVLDNLWNLLQQHDDEYDALPLDTKLCMTLVMSSAHYENLCRRRSCLIAQVELWYPFTKSNWRKNGIAATPCNGDKQQCICQVEAEFILDGKNSTTVSCPIYDLKKSSIDRRAIYMGEGHEIIKALRTGLEDKLTV